MKSCCKPTLRAKDTGWESEYTGSNCSEVLPCDSAEKFDMGGKQKALCSRSMRKTSVAQRFLFMTIECSQSVHSIVDILQTSLLLL